VACGRGKKEGILGTGEAAPAIHTSKKFRKKMAGQGAFFGFGKSFESGPYVIFFVRLAVERIIHSQGAKNVF
jgi:hypothetical protein